MIDDELERFWYKVLDDIFGGHNRENLVIQKGIFRYDAYPKVQEFINTYEPMLKSLINDRGYIDGSKLNIPYISLPKDEIRLGTLYETVRPFLQNVRRLLL